MATRGVRLSSKKKKLSYSDSQEGGVLTVKCVTDADIVGKIIFEGDLNRKDKHSLRGTPQEGKHNLKRSGRQSVLTSIPEKIISEVESQRNKSTPSSEKKHRRHRKDESEIHDKSSNDEEESEHCLKPSGLCDDDVAGDEICSFRTPKKRQGMYKKALESAGKTINPGTPQYNLQTPSRNERLLKTPSNNVTPRKRMSSVKRLPSVASTPNKNTPTKTETKTLKMPAETPYNLRAKNKRAIQTYVRNLKAVDDAEDSDFCGSEESSSESENGESLVEEDDSSSDSDRGSMDVKPLARRSLRFQNPPSTKKKIKDTNYVFTAEQYFESQSIKCSTSDRKLSRLQTPRLERTVLQDLLSHCSVSHSHILAQRLADDKAMFQRWMFALSQGFSVLAYGLGSKYKILQKFHREMLPESHVLVVNGFFPTLNIKEVVEMVARDLLGLKQILPSAHAMIDWIESRHRMPRVFLLVHNLDAESLRPEKTQRVLSRLASLSRVHLVASVDHINCPLLWDQAKLSAFNFMWEDTTSFLPYQKETSYETSLMVQNSGSLALSSLLSVYRSLPQNSRGVFRILLERHLQENNPKYNGMAFSTLYKKCRDEMLVTSDLLLRTMLNEFLDHEMVKWRRDSEHLYIPVDTAVLQQFHKIVQET